MEFCNSPDIFQEKINDLLNGLCQSPDTYQEKMNGLFNGLEYDRAYSDDILIISMK